MLAPPGSDPYALYHGRQDAQVHFLELPDVPCQRMVSAGRDSRPEWLAVVARAEAAAGRAAAWAGPPPVAMPAISVSSPAAVAIRVVQRIRITSPSTPPRAALSPGVVPARPEVRLTGMLATKHQKAGGGAPCAPAIGRREAADPIGGRGHGGVPGTRARPCR